MSSDPNGELVDGLEEAHGTGVSGPGREERRRCVSRGAENFLSLGPLTG